MFNSPFDPVAAMRLVSMVMMTVLIGVRVLPPLRVPRSAHLAMLPQSPRPRQHPAAPANRIGMARPDRGSILAARSTTA